MCLIPCALSNISNIPNPTPTSNFTMTPQKREGISVEKKNEALRLLGLRCHGSQSTPLTNKITGKCYIPADVSIKLQFSRPGIYLWHEKRKMIISGREVIKAMRIEYGEYITIENSWYTKRCSQFLFSWSRDLAWGGYTREGHCHERQSCKRVD